MGISIDVGMKGLRQDHSYMFQSLSSSSGGMGNLNFLSDYASIKNGSYGRLMKAYYGNGTASSAAKSVVNANQDRNSISISKDSAKTLSAIEKSAEALKSSAGKLTETGSKSVFAKKDVTAKDENGVETTTQEYDTNAVYKAVSGFVDDYNDLVKQAGSSSTRNIASRMTTLTNMAKMNEKRLSEMGITINEDKTMSIDEKTFKDSDMDKVKSMFHDKYSFAARASSQASMIDYTANRESAKANTYTGYGTYSNAYASGSIMDYLF